MNSVSVVTGTGKGTLLGVNDYGSLPAEIVNTVTTEREGVTVYRTHASAGITSSTLLSARAGRQGLWFQNQGAFTLYLRFENAAATNQDWAVMAGAELRATDLSYAGVVTVISPGGNCNVLALETAP